MIHKDYVQNKLEATIVAQNKTDLWSPVEVASMPKSAPALDADTKANTNIDFVDVVDVISKHDLLEDVMAFQSLNIDKLPEKYDWVNVYPNDNQDTRLKKRLILKPDDQHLCGSCWAMAGAGIVNDAYVVAGMVNWTPDISPTYPLINYPQGQCQGGNPARLLEDIATRGGIMSKHCVDYAWCSKNSACASLDSSSHFNKNLSALLPREGGRCFFESKQYLYTLDQKDIKLIVMDNKNIRADNVQTIIKQHIYTYGPVMAGFLTFRNFQTGAFTKVNNGVYLEKGNYDGGGPLRFSEANVEASNLSGGHAVAIMGWGVAKDTKVGNGAKDYANVPYWYCRNSWGKKWGGDGGYFKMAMYPYNHTVQFIKTVRVMNPRTGRWQSSGGVLTVKVRNPPVETTLPKFKNPPTKLTRSLDYYQMDEDKVVTKHTQLISPDPLPPGSLPAPIQMPWIILIIVVVVVMLMGK